MKEITLTKGFVAIVDDDDYEWLAQYKWYACEKRHLQEVYATREEGPRNAKIRISMHREILGLKKGDKRLGDHKDRNTLNNQRYNLRIVSTSLNRHNSNMRHNNTSGFLGVTWHAQRRKWMAQINVDKHVYLGLFTDPILAALAYDHAVISHYGEDSVLNFPLKEGA